MKRPLLQKSSARHREHGITMLLVALAMIAIVAMAALSIDVITLYLAKQEAQRTADSAALASAKIIALSGITGDPTNSTLNWSGICGGNASAATLAAQAVVEQNAVSGIPPASIVVTYSGGVSGGSITPSSDCTTLASSTAFGVNPLVTVKVTSASLPSFFSRIWGNPGQTVSATATAEAFNPSNSGNEGNQITGSIIPVQPRCVKPWVVANRDPLNPLPSGGVYCDQGTTPCNAIVKLADGSIVHQGISTGGSGANGIIGETFWLTADCKHDPNNCTLRANPIKANYTNAGDANLESAPNLLYVPGQVTTPVIGVPSGCGSGGTYETAIVGCDQATNYSCGVQPAANPNPNVVDLSINPNSATANSAQCLIYQGNTGTTTDSSGQDYFATFAAPGYPFQIIAGSNTPLGKTGLSGAVVTVSPSIVSLPIYDDTSATLTSGVATQVTFVGFLQVFINAFDSKGNMLVTVLNVAGCSNSATANPITANSPLPVRLITPP